jgi:hypothetical protein
MRCGAGRGAVRVRVRGVVKVRVTTELGYLYYIYKPSRYTTTAAAAVESGGVNGTPSYRFYDEKSTFDEGSCYLTSN